MAAVFLPVSYTHLDVYKRQPYNRANVWDYEYMFSKLYKI